MKKILLTFMAIAGCALLLTACKDKVDSVETRTYPATTSVPDDGTVEYSSEISEDLTDVEPEVSEEADRGVVGQNLTDDFENDDSGNASASAFPGEDYAESE